jgi:hypothetical protein
MASIKDDTIGGLNEYLATLAREAPTARVYLTMFDSQSIDTVVHGRPVTDVKPLTLSDYTPRGMTPLYDAIGHSVTSLDSIEADNKTLVILTDGQENTSVEFSQDAIKALLKDKQTHSNWLVQYLGANQDAFAEGHKIGTRSHSTMNFSPFNIRKGFSASAAATIRYANSGDLKDADYTQKERDAACDEE